MLEAIALSKHFKQQKAVQSVNMYLGRGEIIGLLGPNGAGKSTAIAMMSSLVAPTSGEVHLNNENIFKKPQALRAILGVVPQEIALYNELTAKENLEFFGRIYGLKKQVLKQRVTEVLQQIGLENEGKKCVKHFSGGMKRRLNIGTALLHEPEILIMDEPTVGIDPQSRNYILETVKRLNKERQMTILYTSHYMEEVEFLCERIYIMDRGSIIASGTKDEIKHILSGDQQIQIKMERHNDAFIEALKADPVITKLDVQEEVVTIVVPKEVHLFAKLFKIAEETEAVLISVDVKTPTLEDVFLHLTGRTLRN